ncbi:Hypothetical protein LUCI_4355 [Lucifera butyrica]|uniref:Uncharacterized protein n=1 Tax=Lucifera butyrica TaxID=1351585 RepID=A0A498RCS0_9FIRM|nr:hypothetical protein [Lucifera butyrica]VBB09069.1 Hypothetical protein LUCI_4355 [Lucifera butyrica]
MSVLKKGLAVKPEVIVTVLTDTSFIFTGEVITPLAAEEIKLGGYGSFHFGDGGSLDGDIPGKTQAEQNTDVSATEETAVEEKDLYLIIRLTSPVPPCRTGEVVFINAGHIVAVSVRRHYAG